MQESDDAALRSGTEYGTTHEMTRRAAAILDQSRRSQANLRFRDLVKLVEAAGYSKVRQSRSHLIFAHGSRKDLPIVNLQADGQNAKPYQVRQVLRLIDEHKLEVR